MYTFKTRRQESVYQDGLRVWQVAEETATVDPAKTAIVLVDMWDKHWSTGATRRCGVLAEKIDAVVRRARDKGVLIVHAPSDTDPFYEGAEARKRFLSLPDPGPIPEPHTLPSLPSPLDASDGGSDTIDEYPPNTGVWTRQTEKIFIDQSRDLISCDDGKRVWAHFQQRGIELAIYMGVHTNMCVVGRSFAIFPMLRRGLKTLLVRDLTDTMYNPLKSPYVQHDEGTRLFVEFLEKFYCPTIDSSQL